MRLRLISQLLLSNIFLLDIALNTPSIQAASVTRIAVIFPSDDSNINSVGNSLGCMINAVLDEEVLSGSGISYQNFNDKRDLIHAVEVANEIVSKKYDLAIGTTLSSQALIVSGILDKAGIPFFAPLATHPDVVQGRKHAIRLPFNDEQQARILAKYAHQQLGKNGTKILIVENQSVPYSTFLAEAFKQTLQKYAHRRQIEKYSFIDGDFAVGKLEEKMRLFKPNLTFAPLYSADVAAAYNAAQKSIIGDSLFLGADAVGANDRLLSAIPSFRQDLPFRFVQHNPEEYLGPHVEKFHKTYKEKCSKYPFTMNVAAGFDLATATVQAIRAPNYKAGKFASVLRGLKYPGVLGNLNFDESGEPKKPIHIYTIKNRAVQFLETVQ